MKIKSLGTTILILTILCFSSACGGGSKGTGGEIFKGFVVNEEGSPLPNVSIVLPQFGDESVTDENGRFLIQTDLSDDTVQVLLEGVDFSVTINIYDVPRNTKSIVVTFSVLKTENGAVPSVEAIEFN